MGSKKAQVVGYRYYMGLHFGLCYGPADQLQAVKAGDRIAWIGNVTNNATVSINQPNLFGGDKKEGGIAGALDVNMGGAAQGANAYLQSRIGAAIPAFRGIVSAVWNGGLVAANNPYVKPWAFRVKRILQGWSTGAAWYPEKAQIAGITCVEPPQSYTVLKDFDGNRATSDPDTATIYSEPNPLVINCEADDIVKVSIRPDGVYKAWSLWLGYYPGTGPTIDWWVGSTDTPLWNCEFSVKNAAGAISTYLSTRYMTPELANAAAVAAGPVTLTGSTQYKLWLRDDYLSNRGGLSVSVTVSKPNELPQVDMNPAHIVYQCLTDTAWGMGYPTSAIDDAKFRAAADKLFDEGFGLSMVWNQQDTIESFIRVVLDHIGGILYVDPTTGKFALKLIRDDYTFGALPQFGPSNLINASDYQRQAWGETVNEVTVIFRDPCANKDAAVTVQDLANIQTQGAVVAQTRQYPGITRVPLASRVAQRDLASVSTPLARVRLSANREAWDLIPGDVFRLTWPEYGVTDAVFRVLEVNRGTLQNGAISIDAVEDVFGLPTNVYVAEQPGGWVDPATGPQQLQTVRLIDAPYWDLARTLSAADLDYLDPLAAYLETLAVRPSGDSVSYEINTKVGVAAYEERAVGEFCPTALLSSAIGKTSTTIAFGSGVDVDLVAPGGYAIVDDEVVGITAINATAGTATITRGVLDTVAATHAAGARIWFADGYQGADPTEYADGEVVDVKLLPRTGLGELPIESTGAVSVTLDQRHHRPYPPGKLRVGGAAYPEWIAGTDALALTWAHRDRTLQTAFLVDETVDSIGPEAGVSYTLRLYNEEDLLKRTVTGLSGTSYTYSLVDEFADVGGLGGDEFYPSVSLSLHFNGADGSTTFVDSSITPKTPTVNGAAQIDTAQFKFGGASGLFNGTDAYLQYADNAGFNLGPTDFTIEVEYRPASTGTQQVLVTYGQFAAPFGSGIGYFVDYQPDGKARFGFFTGNSLTQLLTVNALTAGQFNHIAVARAGNVYRIFLNGNLENTITTANAPNSPSSAVLLVGRYQSSPALLANGWMDELRITKGVARYTASFTRPAEEFPEAGEARLNGRLRFELESVRDGLVSLQRHNHTVRRYGYGFNYGEKYGGE